MALLTHFVPDVERRAVLNDCIDNYGVGSDEAAEWPNNILSRRTVVYGSGTIVREGEPVTFAVDSDELDLCVRLANEAATIMKGEVVGMGSESGAGFSAFWICANGDERPNRIDEDLIRSRFGGTIFPSATIETGPISRESDIFGHVRQGFAELMQGDPDHADHYQQSLGKWEALVDWFNSRESFREVVWIAIGDENDFYELPEEKYPPGTEMTPSALPRLLVGLTHKGSLCGLFGFVVYT